jgi:hypothetical protein
MRGLLTEEMEPMTFAARGLHCLMVAAFMFAFGNANAQTADANNARALLESAAEAMGGLQRLQALQNFQYTGFGQRYAPNGNLSPDLQAPAKWQSVVDATRSFDLRNWRALNRERNSFQYPLAASFGHAWALGNTLQQDELMLDHPLPAVLRALDGRSEPGVVSSEDGYAVVQFNVGRTPMWIALDPITRLPYWTRRIAADPTLGDVSFTTYFTGYVEQGGIQLPYGLHTRMDFREQSTLMFQVDSYRLDVPQLPEFPAPPERVVGVYPPPAVTTTQVAQGVWDLRIMNSNGRGGDGGLAIEFTDHLVLFEAYGSEAQTLARIDAANTLVPGKEVTHIIVTHHHADHAAGVRAAVSRGITIVGERGNEALYREWVARSAANFPDALQRNPKPLKFLPVDGSLVLEDAMQRLEVYHVVGHPHMGNAVFAYLPRERLIMEGDLSDVNWEWHWWAYALQANIEHYGLAPARNAPVHGEILSLDDTLARIQQEAEAAQAFCAAQQDIGYRFFGCPVRYDARGLLP